MSMNKIVLSFATLALAVASAASGHRVKVFVPSLIGSSELKPGEYIIEMDGESAVIKDGKRTVQTSPCKVEENAAKYAQTSIIYSNADGKNHVQEIHLGGTKTKLIFAN
jgi:hypothetical protein